MLIEIRKLTLDLGSHAVLRDVNLTQQKGQIYGLLGPNGAGKSTTISVQFNTKVKGGSQLSSAHSSVRGNSARENGTSAHQGDRLR